MACSVGIVVFSLRFSIDFDWWNGVEGLGAWLDELCVRSRELGAWIIGDYTSGYKDQQR